MVYFTSVLSGTKNGVPVTFTYTYETLDNVTGNADAYTYLKKVAKKECDNNFQELKITHNSITLAQYNTIVKGVFEKEDVSDVTDTPQDLPE